MDAPGKLIAEVTVAIGVLIAIVAGIIDYRQHKRRDLDRVTLLDWRNVQVFAVIASVIALALAVHL